MDKLNVIWILGESIRNYSSEGRSSKYKLIDKISPEGTFFNNMIVSAPSTIMSHSSMMTGQPSAYLNRSYANLKFDVSQFPSLSHMLKENGYTVYTTTHYAEGRKLFKELICPLNDKDLPKEVKNDVCWPSENISLVLDHLLEKGLKEPFFLLLNYNNQSDTEELIELAIEKMKKNGLYEQSIFIFCPDHGCPDIDRNGPYKRHHGMVLTDASILLPFFIKWPNCPKKTVNRLVSLLDVVPTILNILEIPYQKYNLNGNSLLPLITDEGEYTKTKFRVDTRYIFQDERPTCIRSDQFKYIIYPNKQTKNEEFFDLSIDPDEKNNLIQSKKYESDIQEFRDEFKKTEEEIINVHLNYLIRKFKNRLSSVLDKKQTEASKKIFLLGSAHYLFIKAILDTITVHFPEYKIDLVIAQGFIEEEKYADNVNFHYVEIEQKDYEHTMPDYNKQTKVIFNKYPGKVPYGNKIPIRYHSILHDGFKQKHADLCNKEYDLVLVPLDNPYGVGHKELVKIVKELKAKKIVYIDYNMDSKKTTNWFLKGLRLINTKKRYYLTNPKNLLREIKRYYLEEVKSR